MCQPPAVALSITLSVLAESADASAALVVPSSPVGDHADVDAVLAFARECDVVTFDHEQVPGKVLAALEKEGVILHPSRAALVFAQDKLAMRRRLTDIGVACPAWAQVRDAASLQAFGDEVGWPLGVLTTRGGYDGKGVRVVGSPQEVADWLSEVARDSGRDSPGSGLLADGLLAEERVDFVRELAVLIARSPSGQAAAWPVVETVQTGGICTQVLAPAPDLDAGLAAVATEAGLRIAGELGVGAQVDAGWDEQNFGDWDDESLADLVASHPEDLQRFRKDPRYARPGGEAHVDLQARVLVAFERAVAHGGTVVVASHRKPIMTVLSYLLEIPHERIWRLATSPASLTSVEVWTDGGTSVAFVNDTSHLR